MNLKKNYFSTIFISALFIAFFILFFNIQEYYIQKYNTLESKANNLEKLESLNNQLNKANSYYQTNINNINNKQDEIVDILINKEKNNIKKVVDLEKRYKSLEELNKKTVHKFVVNMLRYNPYLLEGQIVNELSDYFESTFIPLKIVVKEESFLKDNNIIIDNNITKSILVDKRELNLIFKKAENFEDTIIKNTKIENYQIKPYIFNKDKLKLKKENRSYKIKRFLTFEQLIFVVCVILFLMLVRIILVVRYNIKVKKIFLNTIKEEKTFKQCYFLRDENILELVEKYNALIKIRGDIMEKSSSLQKRHEQFIADSIHQIKTPLSSIMINLDLIEMSIDREDISGFISQMKTSIDMLTLTYEELSYLSMNSSIEYKKTYLNLSETTQQRVDFFKQIAINNDKKIVSSILSNLYTTINKIEFERIVDNNLINAIKYSKSNSIIELSFIKEDEKSYKLTISSKADKIKNSQDIFKRHYREEEGKRGHGLGLAITKEICDKYNIDIIYKYEDEKNIFQYLIKVT